MSAGTNQRIDGARLWDSLMSMAAIGATPGGGVTRLALGPEDGVARGRFRALCEAAGFPPDIGFEADDLPTVRGLVAAGLGVAVVPAMGMPAPATFARVRMLPLTDAHAQREVGVAWVTGRPLLPSAESFRPWSAAELRTHMS